jgi:hypothetical protein
MLPLVPVQEAIRGGARKKIARCITAICMLKWEFCTLFGQYLGCEKVSHGALPLSLPGAHSKIWTQLLANFLFSLVHVSMCTMQAQCSSAPGGYRSQIALVPVQTGPLVLIRETKQD